MGKVGWGAGCKRMLSPTHQADAGSSFFKNFIFLISKTQYIVCRKIRKNTFVKRGKYQTPTDLPRGESHCQKPGGPARGFQTQQAAPFPPKGAEVQRKCADVTTRGLQPLLPSCHPEHLTDHLSTVALLRGRTKVLLRTQGRTLGS